jgi:hypothetical protein
MIAKNLILSGNHKGILDSPSMKILEACTPFFCLLGELHHILNELAKHFTASSPVNRIKEVQTVGEISDGGAQHVLNIRCHGRDLVLTLGGRH